VRGLCARALVSLAICAVRRSRLIALNLASWRNARVEELHTSMRRSCCAALAWAAATTRKFPTGFGVCAKA
jgi:hypothetical protein